MRWTTLSIAALACLGLVLSALPSAAGGKKYKSHSYKTTHTKVWTHKATKAHKWAAKMDALRAKIAAKKARWSAYKAHKKHKTHVKTYHTKTYHTKKHYKHARKAPTPLG
jgi:hypothetical protein